MSVKVSPLLALLAGAMLVGSTTYVFTSAYSASHKRLEVGEAFDALAPFKERVAADLLENREISINNYVGALDAIVPVQFARLDRSGTLTVYLNEVDALLVLQPAIVNGKVQWSCNVAPNNIAGNKCDIEMSRGPDYKNIGVIKLTPRTP